MAHAGQLNTAIDLARQAIQMAYTQRPAWLLLARSYIRLGDMRQALIVLNLVPAPPPLGDPLVRECEHVCVCTCMQEKMQAQMSNLRHTFNPPAAKACPV